MKLKVWHLFLVAIGINSFIGFVIGGYITSGRFFGQTVFYGGFFILIYYAIIFVRNTFKKSKNLKLE